MELADLEYHYITRELKEKLVQSHISKIYQLTDVLFKLTFAGKTGKHTLLVQIPKYITLTSRVLQPPETPSNFIMALRKRIMGGQVEDVYQNGFERIVFISIKNQGKRYKMIIELFSRGNIILCNEQGIIEVVYRSEEWKDRKIARGLEYRMPPSKLSPYDITTEHITLCGKKSLFAGILSRVSIAPKYLEEAFFRAGINPKINVELSEHDRQELIERVHEVCNEGRYYVYMKDGKIVDYSVCSLSKYADFEKMEFGSVCELIDKVYEPVLVDTGAENNTVKEKEKAVLEEMKVHLEELRRKAEEYKQYGDLIYSNYALLERLVEETKLMERKGMDDEQINRLLSEIYSGAHFDRKRKVLIVSFD
ncbi:MAG: NFACT family protein [Candidatus Micrarchaeia archaeon]